MTMQETKQKKKLKKSYAELLEEFKNTKKRIAVAYVPLLCEAMKDENPEMDYMEIKEKVVSDAVGDGWNEPYIIRCLPSWIVEADPKRDMHHLRALKVAEAKRNNRDLELKVLKLAQEPFTEPPAPRVKDTSEELDQELHELGIAKFGNTDKSIRELKGRIYQSATDLFEALTDKDSPPDESDDLMVDYIKPTREFRRSLILELDEGDRTLLHNKLHYASVAIEDMLNIIKETK
jgi:hypothetical protein